MLLKGCFILGYALEFVDKIVQSFSAQITVGFWLYYAHEEKTQDEPAAEMDPSKQDTKREKSKSLQNKKIDEI